MGLQDHLELGDLLVEAMIVQEGIGERLREHPENEQLADEYREMEATIARLLLAYLDSVEQRPSRTRRT